MINQERVQKMTRLSLMESGQEGRRLYETSGSKSEYLVIQTVFSLISGTLCYGCMLVVFSCMRFGGRSSLSAVLGVRGMTAALLITYLIFLAVYTIFSNRIAMRRYRMDGEKKARFLKEADALYVSLTEENIENGSDTQD